MTHSISVFGLGYVGTVTAACLAHHGNKVLGVDLNRTKVEAINSGNSPIVEPQVQEIIADAHRAGRLRATNSAEDAILNSEISFLCVGTPSLRNGKLDLGNIEPVCAEIGGVLKKKTAFHNVVLRSTVLPGTAESIVVPALEKASGKRFGEHFGVCVNPEFTREGTAVSDFLEPAITIIGAADNAHSAIIRELYSWAPGRLFEISFRSAEMMKYLCNSWHALKVAFANEVGTLSHELEVDAESLIEIFVSDTKLNISAAYLKPGFAFGGSCLPKDVRALNYRAKEFDLKLPLLESIMPSNEEHLERAIDLVLQTGKRKIAVLGLSFKAATDDLRESPQVQLVKRLLGEGREIQIYDDNVSLGRLIGSNRDYIEHVIPHIGSLLKPNLQEVLKHAEVIVIATRGLDMQTLKKHIRADHHVIDLVNLEKSRRIPSSAAYRGICWSWIAMKILWVKAGGLVPPDTGGKIRSYNILRQLAKHHEITFFSFYAAHENDVHEELRQTFQKVVLIPLNLPKPKGARELVDYAAHLISREPYNLTKYCRPVVRNRLRELLHEEKYDVILCDFLAAAGAIPWGWPCPKVLFTHNVEAAIWRRHYEVAGNPLWKVVSWTEWKRMAWAERRYLKKADHVLAVSQNDLEVFAGFVDRQKLTVAETGADTDFFFPTDEPETPNTLVFTGSMDWLPNEDAILFFTKEIFPLVLAEVPDASLCVVGRNPSQGLKALAASESNIQLTGWVEDVRPYLTRSAVCIVPLRIGGGTRLKIYEAMSMAKAVVSTSIGAEGLPVKNDEHLLVADTPASFADSIVQLLRDPPRREQLGRRARQVVQRNYSWGTVSTGFAQVLETVVRQGRRS